jgi:hypothetical protein
MSWVIYKTVKKQAAGSSFGPAEEPEGEEKLYFDGAESLGPLSCAKRYDHKTLAEGVIHSTLRAQEAYKVEEVD